MRERCNYIYIVRCRSKNYIAAKSIRPRFIFVHTRLYDNKERRDDFYNDSSYAKLDNGIVKKNERRVYIYIQKKNI